MKEDDKSLDDLLEELAQVQERLLELPSDAFAERFGLQKRQDALREQTARFARDWDLDRSSEDLLAELVSLQARLKSIDGLRINSAAQQFSSDGSIGPIGDGGGAIRLNQGIADAQGVGELQARIERIKAILTDRDIDFDKR